MRGEAVGRVSAIASTTPHISLQGLSTNTRRQIQRKLLAWYDGHARDLPWRRRRHDAYAQWVAEIMLQQTRVDTVLQYYQPFLDCFPDVAALARADQSKVLKRWEGLGYYRRALNLHRGAKLLVAQRAPLPGTSTQLRQLPGIGEYTSAAIASIAYGESVAAVDGNVIRVLTRLFDVAHETSEARRKKRIVALAAQLVPKSRPGDFNQAWMDLGSSVCTPKSPDCTTCPLSTHCEYRLRGNNEPLPARSAYPKPKPLEVVALVGVFSRRGRMLVRRRPPNFSTGLWPGLWEFPWVETRAKRLTGQPLRVAARKYGVQLGRLARGGIVGHQLTHRSFHFHVFTCEVRNNSSPVTSDEEFRWVTARGFMNLSVSTAHRKIYDSLARSDS